MQKADWFAVALTTLGISASFLFGGQGAGVIFLIVGLAFLLIWFVSKDRTIEAPVDWNVKWTELANRFEKIPSTVRAEWFSESLDFQEQIVGEQWIIRGDNAGQCESLCGLAGSMLLRSPGIARNLSQLVRSRTDDSRRWLYFLKESRGFDQTGKGKIKVGAYEQDTESGEIQGLASVSSSTCIDCASKETKQQHITA